MKTNSVSASLAVHGRTIATTWQRIFRRAWLGIGYLAFAAIAFGTQPARAAVTEAWARHYGSEAGSADEAFKVVTDAAGNVIVAGTTHHTQTGSGSDILILKYSGAGVPLWTNRYDGSLIPAVAVDGRGNVFVAASSTTIAYSGAGAPLWTNRYDGAATAVAVDASGNVFVTGYSFDGGEADYMTIKYSGAGVRLWAKRYNGPANSGDFATALAVDGTGNVFVTGSSDSRSPGAGRSYDYATVAYSSAGVRLWTKRYNGPVNGDDEPRAVAVDGTGNVFVTGSSYGLGSSDYLTIAYSGGGAALWTNRYAGPGDTGDIVTAMAVSASGNVFVTGYAAVGSGANSDYATIAYSSAGVPLWTNRYSGAGNDWDLGNAVAVDGSGNVLVTGSSAASGGNDYATIAYSGAGVPLWTNRYNGPANGYDSAKAVAVDGSGKVFVTGSSYDGSGGDSDYATIAYSGAGVPLWTNRYGGRGETSDIVNAAAVSASGCVFVTGYSASVGSGANYSTIAYSGAGVPLWTNRFGRSANGYEPAPSAVAVDGTGNAFVTASSVGSGGYSEYSTIAYSGAGVPLWTNRYHGPENLSDQATAIAVDARGNVFVTGTSATIAYSREGKPLWTNSGSGIAIALDVSGNVFVTGNSSDSGGNSDYVTIAYSGAGVPLWTNRYNGPNSGNDEAKAVAVDGTGNVFVTGSSFGSGGYDYATIAYSGVGVALWTNRYDGSANRWDYANAVAVDGMGNVFVTGTSGYPFGQNDYATIAYSGAGVPLWTNRCNGGENGYLAHATAVAVDGSGNVFVTGTSGSSSGTRGDYAMIVYSGAGVPLWTNRYNGPGNDTDWPQSKSSLAIGSDGAVYVAGTSAGLFSSDFATVKYVWQTEIAIQPLSTIPPKAILTLSGPPNSSWAIERALELTGPWTNQSDLLIGPNGSAQFQDTNSLFSAGFYRTRQSSGRH